MQPGWKAIDVGCGPLGILDLLADRVGPAGEAVGLERESRLVELGQTILAQRGVRNARFVLGDVYSGGLPRASFDLVHARLLLINLKDPEGALAELATMVRRGGVVAVQDIDQVPWLCEPPHSVRSEGNPNKTIGLFDRFFELGDITSALSIHRVQPVS